MDGAGRCNSNVRRHRLLYFVYRGGPHNWINCCTDALSAWTNFQLQRQYKTRIAQFPRSIPGSKPSVSRSFLILCAETLYTGYDSSQFGIRESRAICIAPGYDVYRNRLIKASVVSGFLEQGRGASKVRHPFLRGLTSAVIAHTVLLGGKQTAPGQTPAAAELQKLSIAPDTILNETVANICTLEDLLKRANFFVNN